MTLLLLSIVWVLVVAGLLARAITQYRHYRMIRPSEDPMSEPAPPVTVIVPARNEEENIGRCVEALRAQDYPGLRVVVIDDNSQDGTAGIVRQIAGQDERVRLIEGAPLPEGWMGKPHACWQGAASAQGEWLCFIDADTTAERPLIRTAVQAARAARLDLLSLQPFQELVTPWERLILPTGFFLIAFTQDLRRTSDPALPEASVNGQFLLIRRSAYDAAGGHAAVRDALAEDSALARAIKAAGGSVAVVGTQGLLHTRMYTSRRSLWEGVARQAGTLLGGFALLPAAVAALLLAWVPLLLPAWAAASVARGGGGAAVAGLAFALAGSLALLGTHVGAARYFRIPFWYGLLFPLGYTLGAGVLACAAWHRSRRRVRWKGRVYGDDAGAKRGPGPVAQAAEVPHQI